MIYQIISRFSILFLLLSIQPSVGQSMTYNNNRVNYDFVVTNEIDSLVASEQHKKTPLIIYAKKISDTIFHLFIYNSSRKDVIVHGSDTRLQILQEAKDKNGEWRPIEYWKTYTVEQAIFYPLQPKNTLRIESAAYSGSFKTKVRFKFINNNKYYYSNIIDTEINPSQFVLSEKGKELSRYNSYQSKVGQELARKMIFLEPGAVDEYFKLNPPPKIVKIPVDYRD